MKTPDNKMHIIDLKDEPVHIPMLAKWHHEEWSYLNPAQTLGERIKKMELYLSGEFIPGTFVAKEGDVVLGSSALLEHDMDTNLQLSPWLASVYVHPEFRNRGIGSALVTHVMKQAKNNHISKLFLFTPDQADFYSRLGWKVLSAETYHGEKVTIMDITLHDK